MSFIENLEKTNITACHFCKSREFKKLWNKDGFNYLKCRKCQVIFVSPQLNKESVDKIHRISHPRKKKHDILRYNYEGYKISLLRKMRSYYNTGQLLDIGCAKGYFIASAHKNGWKSLGLDISQYDTEYAGKILKQKAILADLYDASFPDNYFDVITLFDTLEHVREPLLYLKESYRILRPGGLLYIETPNFNSFPRRLWNKKWEVFFPWHLYYFTSTTLREILGKVGFKIKYLITWGISPFGCRDAVKRLEKIAGLAGDSDNLGDNKEKGLKREKINKIIFIVYNWIKSVERTFFIALEKCNLSLGTKIELWTEKPKDE